LRYLIYSRGIYTKMPFITVHWQCTKQESVSEDCNTTDTKRQQLLAAQKMVTLDIRHTLRNTR
jgi:hypothetical protein